MSVQGTLQDLRPHPDPLLKDILCRMCHCQSGLLAGSLQRWSSVMALVGTKYLRELKVFSCPVSVHCVYLILEGLHG